MPDYYHDCNGLGSVRKKILLTLPIVIIINNGNMYERKR
jgi:hypothetical protein